MSLKTELLIAGCSHEAAKYAVMNWHYSKRMPVGKLFKLGVWEDKKFIGAVIFGMGNTPTLLDKYKIKMFEFCELVRVALTKHKTEVTKIISICLKVLLKQNPKLKVIVSFADPEQGHLGKIYQAGNWLYVGNSTASTIYLLNGIKYHNRSVNPGAMQFGRKAKATIDKSKATKIKTLPKFRYIYCLDKSYMNKFETYQKPYPKEICGSSVTGSTAVFQTARNVQINSAAL